MAMKKEAPRRGPKSETLQKDKPEHKPGPTEYSSAFGRVDPKDCPHPVFLDYVYPYTGICLDCGVEHLCCFDWRTATPGDKVVVRKDKETKVAHVSEGRVLTDDELEEQRHVYHGIWGLAGWSHPDPDADPEPPAGLKFKNNKKPN